MWRNFSPGTLLILRRSAVKNAAATLLSCAGLPTPSNAMEKPSNAPSSVTLAATLLCEPQRLRPPATRRSRQFEFAGPSRRAIETALISTRMVGIVLTDGALAQSIGYSRPRLPPCFGCHTGPRRECRGLLVARLPRVGSGRPLDFSPPPAPTSGACAPPSALGMEPAAHDFARLMS